MVSIAVISIYVVIKSAERNPESASDAFVFAIILIPALIGSALGFLTPLVQMLTTFDSTGITRNYLLWKEQINWESIEEAVLTEPNLYSRMIYIKIIGKKRKFQINPIYYREADKLFELFDDQMKRYKN